MRLITELLFGPFRFAGWFLRSLWIVGWGLLVAALVMVTIASVIGVVAR